MVQMEITAYLAQLLRPVVVRVEEVVETIRDPVVVRVDQVVAEAQAHPTARVELELPIKDSTVEHLLRIRVPQVAVVVRELPVKKQLVEQKLLVLLRQYQDHL